MEIFCLDTKLNISPSYLKPGFAYGGSCLPKDLKALCAIAHDHYLKCPVLENIEPSNETHKERVLEMILEFGKQKIGFFGLSFKEGTDDLRSSPIVDILEKLLGKGFDIRIYDENVNLAKLSGGTGTTSCSASLSSPGSWPMIRHEVVSHSDVIVVVNKEAGFDRDPRPCPAGQDHLRPGQYRFPGPEEPQELSRCFMVRGRHILFIVENNTVPFDRRVWARGAAPRADFGYEVSVICPFDQKRPTISGTSSTASGSTGIPARSRGRRPWAMLLEYLNAFFWESLFALRIFLDRPFSVIHGANPPDHVFLIALAYKTRRRQVHLRPPRPHPGDLRRQVRGQEPCSSDPLVDGTASPSGPRTWSSRPMRAIRRSRSRGAARARKMSSSSGTAPIIAVIPRPVPPPELLGGFRHLVGYVGVIGKQEGIENLLAVAEAISSGTRTGEDIKFAVVGTGPHLKNLIQQAKAMGLGRYFHFFGYVPEQPPATRSWRPRISVSIPSSGTNSRINRR